MSQTSLTLRATATVTSDVTNLTDPEYGQIGQIESLTFSLQIHNAATSGMSDVTNLNITEYTGTQCFVSLMTLSGFKDKRSLC